MFPRSWLDAPGLIATTSSSGVRWMPSPRGLGGRWKDRTTCGRMTELGSSPPKIDGFSTYVGGAKQCIDAVVASPLVEALPSELTHRFDGIGDPINGQ